MVRGLPVTKSCCFDKVGTRARRDQRLSRRDLMSTRFGVSLASLHSNSPHLRLHHHLASSALHDLLSFQEHRIYALDRTASPHFHEEIRFHWFGIIAIQISEAMSSQDCNVPTAEDSTNLDAVVGLLNEIGAEASNTNGNANSQQHGNIMYRIVESLQKSGLLDKFVSLCNQHGLVPKPIATALTVIGFTTKMIPPLVRLIQSSKSAMPQAISNYAMASVKLLVRDQSELAEYVVNWAAAKSKAQTGKGHGRHVTLTEHADGAGEDQRSHLKMVHTSATSWTLDWEGRTFYISLKRKSDTQPRIRRGGHDGGRSRSGWSNNGWSNDNDYNDDNGWNDEEDQYQDDSYYGTDSSQGNNFSHDIEHVLIQCYGSDNAPITQLLENCKAEMSALGGQGLRFKKIRIDARGHHNESHVQSRSMESLDLHQNLKDTLLKDALDFFSPNMKLWHQKMNAPWTRGYCLYGPPGTGKSSFIAALATETRMPVYTIDLAGSTDENLTKQFGSLPEGGCIVVIEDIDSAGIIWNDDKQQTDLPEKCNAAAEVSSNQSNGHQTARFQQHLPHG